VLRGQVNHIVLIALASLLCQTSQTLAQGQNHRENERPTQSASVRTSEEHSAVASTPAKAGPEYVIGPDDVLDVSVWKEPELTRSLQVRPDGKISMPLLNDVQAAGLTAAQLSQVISERLKKYLTTPQVTVILTQINSQKVYVLGEVTRPGAYPVLPGMNILQAISSAGGLTPYANTKKIMLMRNENGVEAKYPFSYKEVLDGRRADENIRVKAGDTIVVP
jgi:polysaccharide biosynthesis/export protein